MLHKVLTVVMLWCLMATAASACGRCGYRACRYRQQYSQPVAPVITDRSFNVTYSITLPQPAVGGSTGFVYTAPQYNLLDPSLWLNSATRYQELSQQLASQGNREMTRTATLIIQGQQNIAEIQARAELLKLTQQILQSTKPARPFQIVTTVDERGEVKINQRTIVPGGLAVNQIIAKSCLPCHSAGKKKGGLDLTNVGNLPQGKEKTILSRILYDRPGKPRMPLGSDPLPLEHILTFVRESSSFCAEKAKGN